MPHGSEFVGRRMNDASAAAVCVRSLWEMLSLSRQRRGLETKLAEAQRQLGDAAEKSQAGGELPAMQGVREARSALTKAQTELEQRKGALAAADEKRREEEARHNEIVAPLEADYGKLHQQETAATTELSTAKQQVRQLERDVQRVQASLASAAPGKPLPQPAPVLQQQLATLQQSLETARLNLVAATDTHQQATAAAAQKRIELDQAKAARKQALATGDTERGQCDAAVKGTEATIHSCEGTLTVAHGVLGKAVLEANLSGAGIDEAIGKARDLMQQLSAIGVQSSQTRAQASANRGGAIRSAASLVVVVLAVSLIWMLAARLVRPRHPSAVGAATQPVPSATGSTTQPVPATTTNPATVPASMPSTSPAGAVRLKPEDLHAAILAMPSLAVRADDSPQKNPLFQPTGKITCTERRPMPGGNEMFRFSVEVQTRPSASVPLMTSEMAVEVVVDEAGRVLSSRTTGYTDPDMLDILRNEVARPGR